MLCNIMLCCWPCLQTKLCTAHVAEVLEAGAMAARGRDLEVAAWAEEVMQRVGRGMAGVGVGAVTGAMARVELAVVGMGAVGMEVVGMEGVVTVVVVEVGEVAGLVILVRLEVAVMIWQGMVGSVVAVVVAVVMVVAWEVAWVALGEGGLVGLMGGVVLVVEGGREGRVVGSEAGHLARWVGAVAEVVMVQVVKAVQVVVGWGMAGAEVAGAVGTEVAVMVLAVGTEAVVVKAVEVVSAEGVVEGVAHRMLLLVMHCMKPGL